MLNADSDCILHGYIKKLGGPFASAWQTRYARLYPNRLELHYESSSSKPELVLMDHIEEINSELTTFKGEQSILLRTKEGGRVVLTNQVRIVSPPFFFVFFLSDCHSECTFRLVFVAERRHSLVSHLLASVSLFLSFFFIVILIVCARLNSSRLRMKSASRNGCIR